METQKENTFWLVIHVLISLLLTQACDTPSGVTVTTAPAATTTSSTVSSTTPVSETPSCPAVFNPIPAGQTWSVPTFWVCDSGCGSLPFEILIFSMSSPTGSAPYGGAQVTIGTSIANGYAPHGDYATSGNTQSLTPVPGGKLTFGSSTQPWGFVPVGTQYSAYLDCNQLIVDGVTFTYSTTPEGN